MRLLKPCIFAALFLKYAIQVMTLNKKNIRQLNSYPIWYDTDMIATYNLSSNNEMCNRHRPKLLFEATSLEMHFFFGDD